MTTPTQVFIVVRYETSSGEYVSYNDSAFTSVIAADAYIAKRKLDYVACGVYFEIEGMPLQGD